MMECTLENGNCHSVYSVLEGRDVAVIAVLANPHDINTYLFLVHEGDKSVRSREIRDKEKLRDKQFPVRHFPQVFSCR